MGGPTVLFAARTRCAPDWRWRNLDRQRSCANLWLIVDGRGTWSDDARTFPLSAGDLFVQRLWRECLGTHDPRRPLDVLWANVGWRGDDGLIIDLAAHEALLPALHRRVDDLAFVASVCGRMIAAFERCDRPGADRWLACALDEAARADARDAADPVLRLAAAVRAEPERPWRVAGLAREAGLAVDVFARRFRAATGLSPRKFLMHSRLDAAKALLRMSDAPVGAVAERLGFCDIYHFSRRFRRHIGCSPTDFRAGRGGRASI